MSESKALNQIDSERKRGMMCTSPKSVIASEDRPKRQTMLKLTACIWPNDFYALKKNLVNHTAQKHKIMCQDECYTVLRLDNNIYVVPTSAMEMVQQRWPSAQSLLEIRQQQEHFVIIPLLTTPEPLESKEVVSSTIWLLVRSCKGKSYVIKEGDILKFGKFKARIKELASTQAAVARYSAKNDIDERETVVADCEIFTESKLPILQESFASPNLICDEATGNSNERTNRNLSGIPLHKHFIESSLSLDVTSNTVICRICLGEGETEEDPFVEPCGCKGSMKYVHLLCLRKWMEGRMEHKGDDRSKCYFWKSLNCELCHEIYPAFVNTDRRSIPLYELPRPQKPYVMLEPEEAQKNGLHVISMDSRSSIRIGRGHDAEVRLNDISISRCHASLKYINDRFIIEDLNSKFGTLLQMKDNVILKRGQGSLTFQVILD